jgi:hypothetical protein
VHWNDEVELGISLLLSSGLVFGACGSIAKIEGLRALKSFPRAIGELVNACKGSRMRVHRRSGPSGMGCCPAWRQDRPEIQEQSKLENRDGGPFPGTSRFEDLPLA